MSSDQINPGLYAYELKLRVRTNMAATEIAGLLEGLSISAQEFGKEHIEMPRYEDVILHVLEPGGYQRLDD